MPTSQLADTPNDDPSAGPFVADAFRPLLYQQKQYLLRLLKPCPRAGCEDALPDWDLLWLFVPNAPIPPLFLHCLTPDSPETQLILRARHTPAPE